MTAIAVMDSHLLCIDALRFRHYIQHHPEIGWRMMGSLSKRLHAMVTQISSLSLLNAEQRIAEYLLDNLDTSDPEGPVHNVPAPRKKLASRLNLTPETLCRVLATFRRRGWIESTANSALRVLDARGLQDLVNKSSSGNSSPAEQVR